MAKARVSGMRIAVLSTFPPRKCGIAYLTQNLFDSLRAQGHELVTFGVDDSASEHPLDTSTPWGLLKAAWTIRKLGIRHVSVQYIISFYNKRFAGLNFLLFLLALRDRRVIVTLHEVHRIRSFGQLLRKPSDGIQVVIQGLIARLAAGVIVLSDAQGADLAHYGAREYRRVYLGILPKPFARERIVHRNALFFGKLLPSKGAHLFPEIARLCPEFRFVIACSVEPQHREYAERLRAELAEIPNLVFVCKDWIGDEEKEGYFAEADVLVLPYVDTFYNQSGVAAEAGVYNIPNVITNLGSLGEVTRNFRTGETVSKPDPVEIRAAILRIFADYPAYLEGIRRYREEANWDRIAQRYAEYLSD